MAEKDQSKKVGKVEVKSMFLIIDDEGNPYGDPEKDLEKAKKIVEDAGVEGGWAIYEIVRKWEVGTVVALKEVKIS